MNRLLLMLPPLRWWRTLVALRWRARVHPQALLLGRSSQVMLDHGCKIGAGVRIDPGKLGHVSIGKRVWIANDVEMETNGKINIGEGTTIQRRCTINGSTRLGRECILAPGVFISSGTHPFRAIPHLHIREQERRLAGDALAQAELDEAVWVQDDCWLGTNVVVCPGVTIGKGTVVGANAVVTRDVTPYSVIAGSPARVIGTRLDWRPPSRLDPTREEDHPYLLDARIRGNLYGACIEVSSDSPLHAALAAPEASCRVQINCLTTQDLILTVGCSTIKLPCGETSLELGTDDLKIEHGIAWCTLAIGPDNPSGVRLDVISLQVLQN